MGRKLMGLMVAAFAASLLLTGCANVVQPALGTPMGAIYSDVKGPLLATSQPTYSKVGEAECESILGWIARGDASIETACKKAGITKIHHIDYRQENVLGVHCRYTLTVYGD